MSTDMITYLNYMPTWDSETDENIQRIINKQELFASVGDFNSDSAVDAEFDVLTDMAKTLRNETIAADATQIAADGATVAAIWTFGLGMAAFAALETAETIKKTVISDKSKELNNKLATINADISTKINQQVNIYVIQYKVNNNLITSKAPKGLDARRYCSILMQFTAYIYKYNGTFNIPGFKKYTESARILYNSNEINNIYNALDKLNLSAKSANNITQILGYIKGLNFSSTAISIVRNISITIMAYKLNITNKTIAKYAKAAGLEVAEVESSAFGIIDAVGKFTAVVAVVISVVDTVLEVLDIIDVVEQTKKYATSSTGRSTAVTRRISTASKHLRSSMWPLSVTARRFKGGHSQDGFKLRVFVFRKNIKSSFCT